MHHDSNHRYRGATPVGPSHGFTLIELMIAAAIAVILAAVAGPSFVDLTAAQRVKTATLDFYSGLTFARGAAIARKTVVEIAPRNGNFANGWDIRAGAAVLRSQSGLGGVAVSVPAGMTLAYDQDGRLTSSGRYVVRLTASENLMIETRCVIIDPGGRSSIRVDANRDGNCFNG